VVPADPTPIVQARTQDFSNAETDFITANYPTVTDPTTGIPIPSNTNILTQNANNLTSQPMGIPIGLDADAVMPLAGTTQYAIQLPLVSVVANGTYTISVTCSSPHGLSTNDQVSVSGLSSNKAVGFFSVTVTTATAFTYQTGTAIPAGSLLTTSSSVGVMSKVITALVGVPYDYTQIPQTGL